MALATTLSKQRMRAFLFEVKKGVSWLVVTPTVVRDVWERGKEMAAREAQGLEAFAFWLGSEHPVYQVFGGKLPQVQKPYAWYMRVPDVAAFLRLVAPVLQRRLSESALAGHSGELRISFYRAGVQISFEGGKVSGVQSWAPESTQDGNVAFPELTFLQLLFGYRSLDELDYAFADCWAATDEARALVSVLFPRLPSQVWPIV